MTSAPDPHPRHLHAPHATVVEHEVWVAAPPHDVWKVVADPRNLPLWDRHIAGVEGVPPGGLALGTEYVTVVRIVAVSVRVPAHVVELEVDRRSRILLDGVIEAEIETNLLPDGNGTLLRQRVAFRFRGGPLGEFVARAVRMTGAPHLLRHGMEAQKRQVEVELRRRGE